MFKYRAIQGFNAEGPGELTITAGDLVISQTNIPTDGWLQVKALRGNGEGFVPFGYLEFLNQQQQQQQQQAPPPAQDLFGGANLQPPATVNVSTPAQDVFPPPATSTSNIPHTTAATTTQYEPSSGSENPFDNLAPLQASLPATNTSGSLRGGPLSAADRGNRHSYAISASQNPVISHQYNQHRDQYKVTNPEQFQETLELWRERERRFMKGEPERLPEPKKREYYYWDRAGNRHGPLTEEEMRQKFDHRQLSADTPISLQIESETLEAVELSSYFPEINSAFQIAPVVQQNKTGEIMWVYMDDVGQIQGPFSAPQMREWFQDGYFNAESLVKLANDTTNEFVQLGLLFPEGEGAFLSEGDQLNAKTQQAAINAGNIPGTSEIPTYGTINPFEQQQQQQQQNPYATTAAFGTIGAVSTAAATTSAWGGPEQVYVPPPPETTYQDVSGLDPFAASTAPNDGGKALFVKALSNSELNQDQLGAPPPALGGGPPPALGAGYGGAPPAALQQQKSDDWGITWDDEPTPSPAMAQEATSHEDAVPLTVTHTEEEEEEDHSAEDFPVTTLAELRSKYLNSVDALYVFLTRSLPKSLGIVKCKIKRSVVGLHVNYNLYELFLEEEDGTLGPQILIAQKHRKYAVDSYYNLAIGRVNQKESGKVISSLIFNSLGTNFVAHNNVAAHKGNPRDLACVVYQRSSGKRPRKFQVAIPALRDGSETEQVEWRHQGSVKRSKMLQALVSLDFPKLQPLVNKKPVWSKKHKAWVLNFHGRVTRSSVKNFQLVRPDDDKNIVLQFGRIGTDTFTMDMQWPISPVAAFAICVSSLHSKLAVE